MGRTGLGEREVIVKWYGVSFRGNENILRLIVVIVAQLCEHTKNH